MTVEPMQIIEFQNGVQPATLVISIVVTLATGIGAIILSKKQSPKYKYWLSSIAFSALLAILFYWIQIDMVGRDIEWYRSSTNSIDVSMEALTKAMNYHNRINFLYILSANTVFAMISLLLRQHAKK